MRDEVKPHSRGRQILKILGEHGSLSVRGLSKIIKPAMARRKLQECLQRLNQKGYVTKRNDTLFGGAAVFYQLTSDKLLLAEIALKTDMDLEKLPPPKIWSAELLHSESCAVLCEKLKLEFPAWKVIREVHFHHYPRIKNILLETDPDTRQRPDMMMWLKSTPGRPSTNIAVEVERTQKSERRIREKLDKYASESRLDGVIYFCEDDSMGNRLRLIYKSKIFEQALRIKHYGDNFLLLSPLFDSKFPSTQFVFDSAGKRVFFADWLSELTKTSFDYRRDAYFQRPALEGPPQTDG